MITHTYVTMEVSKRTYLEIRKKLSLAGYEDHVNAEGEMDMDGIALTIKEMTGPTSTTKILKVADDQHKLLTDLFKEIDEELDRGPIGRLNVRKKIREFFVTNRW